MKRVLIISYFFPPDLDGGVFRPLKFTKYLPRYGWTPVILKSKIKLQKRFPKDESLSKDFPPNLKIIETFSLCKTLYMLEGILGLKNDVLQIPDYQIGWLPFAIFAGIRTIFKDNINVIYTTGPPHSTHLIGLMLKKICNISWVADFRDPWTKNTYIKLPTTIHKRMVGNMEQKVIEYADRIVTVTEPIKKDFVETYKSVSKEKFMVIPNGFDHEDFEKLTPKKTEKFTITYTGSLYLSISLDVFLKSLKELIIERPELKNSIKVVIAGTMDESHILKQIKELEIDRIVELKGLVSYEKSLELMGNSDVLIVISSSKGYTDQHTKTFLYMAANKVILGLVPKGPAAELITNSGDSIVVHPEDVEGIKDAIYKLYIKYSHGTLKGEVDLKKIEGYNREKLTEKLARVFDEVIK